MTGIAVVGQGYMGRTHAEAWTRLGMGDAIRYVVAPEAREWGDVAPAARFTSVLRDALNDPQVDRVSICTPTPTHASIAIEALRAGKHVLVEKPMALSMADAQRIAEVASSTHVVAMVAQVVRFFAGYEAVASVLASGRLGTLRAVRASRALSRPLWAPWWSDEAISGGVPVDFAIHDYDQANFFLGDPVAVRATQLSREAPLEATIEYASGIAQVLSYPYLPQGSPFSSGIELVGERGQTRYSLISGAPTESGATGVSELLTATVDGVARTRVEDNDPYAREVEYFAECIERQVEPERSSISSAMKALAVSLAVRSSLDTGERVVL